MFLKWYCMCVSAISQEVTNGFDDILKSIRLSSWIGPRIRILLKTLNNFSD